MEIEEVRPVWLGRLFGFAAIVFAVFDMVAFFDIAKIITRLVVVNNPIHPVATAYQIRLGEQLGTVCGGLFCLIAGIVFVHIYGEAETRRILLKRAAIVTSIQLAVIALPALLLLL